ncbi:MAG: HAMP domain-containing sensor histidine kinase [Chloroflexia bacterium]
MDGAVVLLRDITPQREAEQEKDAFLSLIAHQVKSPLTAIKGFAQLARRAAAPTGDPGERIARHLAVIEQQSDRIARLVDELTDANQLRKGTLRLDPAPCDLADLARAAVADQQPALTSHRIALTIAAEPLPIHADPARITQVVAHLLLNAAKLARRRPHRTHHLARQPPRPPRRARPRHRHPPHRPRPHLRALLPRHQRHRRQPRRPRPWPLHRPRNRHPLRRHPPRRKHPRCRHHLPPHLPSRMT